MMDARRRRFFHFTTTAANNKNLILFFPSESTTTLVNVWRARGVRAIVMEIPLPARPGLHTNDGP